MWACRDGMQKKVRDLSTTRTIVEKNGTKPYNKQDRASSIFSDRMAFFTEI